MKTRIMAATARKAAVKKAVKAPAKRKPSTSARNNPVRASTDGIKRINMPAPEYNTNKAEVLKAVQCLGGPDNGGTALWWDVD